VAKREPHVVLGVEIDASATQIKAAWRRLARRHHPDLIGDDPEASRIATRQMAEINEAYASMTRPGPKAAAWAPKGSRDGASGQGTATPPRRSSVPRPKPTRPVTGRLDLSGTVRPRNAPLRSYATEDGGAGPGAGLKGHPPLRWTTAQREPLRASDPTGPLERARVRDFRRPPPPPLDDALGLELEFGKFRGHTLGQVAAFEPSYVDWLAKTITRDPELVAAARVVQSDLDDRGIARREHAVTREEQGRNQGRSA
jgi:hypothetical protein